MPPADAGAIVPGEPRRLDLVAEAPTGGGGMARKLQKLPDCFTVEGPALLAEAPSCQVRMAMRAMLRTGLRIGECLALRPADLRLTQDLRPLPSDPSTGMTGEPTGWKNASDK